MPPETLKHAPYLTCSRQTPAEESSLSALGFQRAQLTIWLTMQRKPTKTFATRPAAQGAGSARGHATSQAIVGRTRGHALSADGADVRGFNFLSHFCTNYSHNEPKAVRTPVRGGRNATYVGVH